MVYTLTDIITVKIDNVKKKIKNMTFACMLSSLQYVMPISNTCIIKKNSILEIRMMKVIWNVIKKIFGILLTILSPLKRLICRRKRRTSDTILPMSNHYSIPQDFNQMPANTEVSFIFLSCNILSKFWMISLYFDRNLLLITDILCMCT